MSVTKSHNLLSVLTDLYSSRINFELSTYWDAGYTVRLGDNLNGFVEESEMLGDLDDVCEVIIGMAVERFPDSDFGVKYGQNS